MEAWIAFCRGADWASQGWKSRERGGMRLPAAPQPRARAAPQALLSSHSLHLLHAWLQMQHQGAHALLQLQEPVAGHCGAGVLPGDSQEGKCEPSQR